jgi:hypothetical protein
MQNLKASVVNRWLGKVLQPLKGAAGWTQNFVHLNSACGKIMSLTGCCSGLSQNLCVLEMSTGDRT